MQPMNRAEGHRAIRNAVEAAAAATQHSSLGSTLKTRLKALDEQLAAILEDSGCSKRSLKTWCHEVGVCARNLKVYGKDLGPKLRRERKLIVPRAVLKVYPTLKAVMVVL